MIGEGNRMAHAAALAAAELPAQAYNPLFLHGPPGLGKTHLLHAIGRYVHRYGGGLRVRYATIEEFTSEFVGAVRERRTEGFKDSFRSADVVLIDDVQFLAGRTRTREEFFHTFNALLDTGRQLVLTSDRPPEDLPDLEDRLSERFRSGLVVELEPPGTDVREAILAKRALLDGVDVRPDVLARDRRPLSRAACGHSRAPSSVWWPMPPYATRSPRRRSSATCSSGWATAAAPSPATSPTSWTPPLVSSGSNERPWSPATAGRPWPPLARSRCTSHAS